MPTRTRTKRKPPPLRLNLPVELQEKLGFLLSKAEDSKAFFARIGKIYPPMDKRYRLIKDAYDTARKAFRDKKRENGGRYFEHLRAVTLILLVFMRERNAKVIAAALLHDIVEDIDGWSIERVEREFGKKSQSMCGGLQNLPSARNIQPSSMLIASIILTCGMHLVTQSRLSLQTGSIIASLCGVRTASACSAKLRKTGTSFFRLQKIICSQAFMLFSRY